MINTIQNFDASINTTQGILIWQYDASPKLSALMNFKQQWYNQNVTDFWAGWYNNVFQLKNNLSNPELATNDFGCAVWSIILNLSLSLGQSDDSDDKPIFGYGSETMTPNSYKNYNMPPDTSPGYPQPGSNYASSGTYIKYTTAEKILILQLRYFTFVSRGTIPDANYFFSTVFNAAGYEGIMYLYDEGDMEISLNFSITPANSRLAFIIQTYGKLIIPCPAGVNLIYNFGI